MEGLREELSAEAAQHERDIQVDAKRMAEELSTIAKTIDVMACRDAHKDFFKRREFMMDSRMDPPPSVCISKTTASATIRNGWCDTAYEYRTSIERHMDTNRLEIRRDGWVDTQQLCGPVYKVALRLPTHEDKK